uniref:Myb/SANT-like DNA-binding domain-containing protein n=1 Tax=Araucaria cunninghamii TaxID=56994 RepID=A0A0D6R6K4_ARACU
MGSDDDDYGKVNLGTRCEWHPETVSRLLHSYGEKCSYGKGYLKTKDWEDIVKYVNIQCEGSKTAKTMKQCREKVDSLKRRYKLEKRKAEIRGSSHVEWSFYDKVDEIMCSVKRSGSGGAGTAASEGHSFELVEPLDFDDGFETHHNHHTAFLCNSNGSHSNNNNSGNCYNSRLDLIVSEDPVADKGKGLLENADGLCDVVLNAVGYENCVEFPDGNHNSNHKRRKVSKGAGFERPTIKSQKRAVSGEKNPVQALADALVGFSEVYSRIEVAKMELFSKLNLELAKLRKRRRKNGGSESGFSSCSDYSCGASPSSSSDSEEEE